jgi:hypothetical protein
LPDVLATARRALLLPGPLRAPRLYGGQAVTAWQWVVSGIAAFAVAFLVAYAFGQITREGGEDRDK